MAALKLCGKKTAKPLVRHTRLNTKSVKYVEYGCQGLLNGSLSPMPLSFTAARNLCNVQVSQVHCQVSSKLTKYMTRIMFQFIIPLTVMIVVSHTNTSAPLLDRLR